MHKNVGGRLWKGYGQKHHRQNWPYDFRVGQDRKQRRRRKTEALLRAMTTVIKRADDLGQEDLVEVVMRFKTNIALEASLQQESERLRAQTERRLSRLRANKTPLRLLPKNRGRLDRRTLYLVNDPPEES